MFYVYVLRCKDGSLYTGYTNDIENRIKQHNNGKGARYTKPRRPVKLVGSWQYKTKSDAMKAEIAFKRLSRSEKLQLLK